MEYMIELLEVNLPMMHTLGIDAAIAQAAILFLRDSSSSTEEFISITTDDLYIFTSLSKKRLSQAIKILIKFELIEVEYKGMPRRQHIKVNNYLLYEKFFEEGNKKIRELMKERIKKIEEYYS